MQLRQIGLIPSGCQTWNHGTLGLSTDGFFASCSTLSVQIYDLKDCSLQQVISAHQRTITSMAWSPNNSQQKMLATSSMDNTVVLWDLETGTEKEQVRTKDLPLCLDWDPNKADTIVIATKNGPVLSWNYARKEQPIPIKRTAAAPANIVRSNPNQQMSLLLTANTDGTVYIYSETDEKDIRKWPAMADPQNRPVDVQWDPLSGIYFVAAFKNGEVALGDHTRAGHWTFFDIAAQGVPNQISWVSSEAGTFATANSKASNVRFWNVSNTTTPMSTKKLPYKQGVHNLAFEYRGPRALVTFTDGTVGIYNFDRKVWEMKGEKSHTETVFDCEFKPSDPNILATGSYDGNVKLWDTSKMTCTASMKAVKEVIYSVSWAPASKAGGPAATTLFGGITKDEDCIAMSTSAGTVVICDTKSMQVKSTMAKHDSLAVYRVHWNPLDSQYLASTSQAGLILSKPDGGVIKTYSHNGEVAYGCHWNPFNKFRIATGCHDAVLRVFDISQASSKPIFALSGHKKRIFNVLWSPLLQNVLASGSDDLTIIVWDLDAPTPMQKVLSGHTQNVRGLAWSYEIPHILVSGSWDGTIRVWNTIQGQQLACCYEHCADVYGLSCHPQRPFVLASSSRDLSLRMWSLSELARDRAMMSVVGNPVSAGPSVDLSSSGLLSPAVQDAAAKGLLCGAGSRALDAKLAALDADVKRAADPKVAGAAAEIGRQKAISDFFTAPQLASELWDLVQALSPACKHTSGENNDVVLGRDLRNVFRAKATELEAVRMKGMGGGSRLKGGMSKEEKIFAAADLHLKLGNLRQYCELMKELGEWDKALSIAPGVSMEFWQRLVSQRAKALEEGGDPDCVRLFLAAKETGSAIDYLLASNQLNEAFLVAKLADETGDAGGVAPAAAAPAAAVGGEGGSSEKTRQVSSAMSDLYSSPNVARPVAAACCALAVEDVGLALERLRDGNEYDLAFAVGRVSNQPIPRDVSEPFMMHMEGLGCWEGALQAAHHQLVTVHHPNAPLHTAARFRHAYMTSGGALAGQSSLDSFFAAAGASPSSKYEASAGEGFDATAASADDVAAKCLDLHLAGQTATAVTVGVSAMKNMLGSNNVVDPSKPGLDLAGFDTILFSVCCVPMTGLAKELLDDILAICAYIGAIRAKQRGFHAVVPLLYETAKHHAVQRVTQFPEEASMYVLSYELGVYLTSVDPTAAHNMLSEVAGAPTASSALRTLAEQAATLAASAKPQRTAESILASSPVVVQGQGFPSNPRTGNFSIADRTVRKYIKGPVFFLGQTNGSCLSLAEAVMWAQVNPYTPAAERAGQFLNPF